MHHVQISIAKIVKNYNLINLVKKYLNVFTLFSNLREHSKLYRTKTKNNKKEKLSKAKLNLSRKNSRKKLRKNK